MRMHHYVFIQTYAVITTRDTCEGVRKRGGVYIQGGEREREGGRERRRRREKGRGRGRGRGREREGGYGEISG